MTKAKIVQKDNGYFEIWEKPDGDKVRINTEQYQYSFRYEAGARTAFHQKTRERLSA